MVKNLSCVSCAAWNVFSINSFMPLCMRSTMRPHDIVTPTDLAKINQIKSKLSLRNGNCIFSKIIPWKYEVNTLKCILPLSWCIQMGSDNIESRATTYDDTQTNHGEIFASTIKIKSIPNKRFLIEFQSFVAGMC